VGEPAIVHRSRLYFAFCPKTHKRAGHALYRSLGFADRDTNNFRLDLTSEHSRAAIG
jgi:hypothetical protein